MLVVRSSLSRLVATYLFGAACRDYAQIPGLSRSNFRASAGHRFHSVRWQNKQPTERLTSGAVGSIWPSRGAPPPTHLEVPVGEVGEERVEQSVVAPIDAPLARLAVVRAILAGNDCLEILERQSIVGEGEDVSPPVSRGADIGQSRSAVIGRLGAPGHRHLQLDVAAGVGAKVGVVAAAVAAHALANDRAKRRWMVLEPALDGLAGN